MKEKREPQVGDAVRIAWLDILENPTADPKDVVPDVRITPPPPGSVIYLGEFEQVLEGNRLVKFIRTSGDYSKSDKQHIGACVYPIGCVLDIIVVRRARVKRVKTPPPTPNEPSI